MENREGREAETDNDKEAEAGFETVLGQTESRENGVLEDIEIRDRKRKVSQTAERESHL